MGDLPGLDADAERIAEWENLIDALLAKKGGVVPAREFQRQLNVLFHDVEAAQYDALHREMWDSLGPVFSRLADDVHSVRSAESGGILADIGCGTGLATELLLQTTLKDRIASLAMVDTSAEMIERCRMRAAGWTIPSRFICGGIAELADSSVDMLLVCSVLHHIVDLTDFCRHAERVVRPGGVFLHLQDAQQGAANSPVAIERSNRLSEMRQQRRSRLSRLPRRIAYGALRRAGRFFKKDYLQEVNRRLLEAGLIEKPMTPEEIWSVTDLRVGNLPYSAADGISPESLAAAMPGFEIISSWTYGFFGVLSSNLPPELAEEEARLLQNRDPNGVFLAGAWFRQE